MKREREEEIMRERMASAGVEITQEAARAIRDGLRQIRMEKYEERLANKVHRRREKGGAR